MARFLVEILINAAGGPKARAAFDDVGASASSAAKRVTDAGLQSERALRRTAEAAERLKDQMEETKASKGLITDLSTLNARLKEQIAALNGDRVALDRYLEKEKEAAQAQRILTAQVKAGVSAQSLMGKEIAEQIRLHDRLQAELLQTARLQPNTTGIDGGAVGRLSGVITTARSFLGTATAVTASVAALGYSVKKLADAAGEGEAVLAQLRAGVTSTGGAAGLTAEELESLASSLSSLTGVDDELIASGEAILLTFRRVREGAFFDAMSDAMDVAARKGMDLESAVALVGKTYSGSLEGAKKAGILFTDSQQKQIKTLLDTGRTLEAQALIHQEFQRSVGGSAAAARDTLAGALVAVQTESGNLIETLAGGLSPVIRDLSEDYVAWAQSAEAQQQMADWGLLLADALRAVVSAADILSPALRLVAIEAKALLTVVTAFLDTVGWVIDKVSLARDSYLGWAHDAGILKESITGSTPEIQSALQTQLDAVFNLRTEYGKLGQAALDAARDQMAAMEAESFTVLTQAQKNRELLKTREETRKKNAQIGAQKDTGPSEVDRELLRQTIELEKHGANLNNIITRQTLRLNEHAVATKKSAIETENLGGSQVDAQASARKLLADLLGEVDAQKKVTAGAKESVTAHKASTLAREQEAKAEQIRTAFIKAGLEWTQKHTSVVYEAVKALRELKTQEDALLKSRELILQVTVDTSSLDKQISDAAARAVQLDLQFRRETFEVNRQNQESFAAQRADVQSQLQEQADYFRSSLITPREEFEAFKRHIDTLASTVDDAGQPLLSAAEAERLRAQAARDFAAETLSLAQSVFSQLADTFGGFFNYLSQAAQTLQNAQQAQSSWSGLASNLGASAGIASMFGAAGAYFVVAQEMYKYYKGQEAKREARRYDHAGLIARHDGQWWNDTSGLQSAKQREFGLQLQRTVEEFVRAIGGSLDSLAGLEVRVRRDGKYFEAWVQGEVVGRFESIEEATQAALLGAFQSTLTTIRGLDPLVRAGLDKVRDTKLENTTLAEAQDFLAKLNEISEIGFPPAIIQLREGTARIKALREALVQLDPTSQAVIDATVRLDAAQASLYASIKNQALGIDTATSDALAALDGLRRGVVDFSSGMEEEIKARIEKAERALSSLGTGPANARGGGAQGEGPVSLSQEEWDRQSSELKAAIARYKQMLSEIPQALTAQELQMGVFDSLYRYVEGSAKYEKDRVKWAQFKVDIEFKLIKMWIQALGLWEQFAGMYEDAYRMAMVGAGRAPRAGGGGGTSKKELRGDLLDEIHRIQAELAGPLHAAFFDFRESLEEFKKRAKEAKLSAADVAAGIAAFTEQFRRQIDAQARTYAGLDTDFTSRLRDIQEFFDELRELGRAKTGMPKWLVDVLEGRALDQLGMELQGAIAEFGGLTNPMLAIQMQASTLRTNLLAFAEAAGWSSEQIAEAQEAINAGVEYQRQQGINSLLDRLFAWMKQAGIQTERSIDHERTKALLDLQLIEAQLRFFGALTEETQGWINQVRGWINSADFGLTDAVEDFTRKQSDWWSRNFGGGDDFWAGITDAIQDWRELVQAEISNIQSLYVNDNLSGLTQDEQLRAAQSLYRDLATRRAAGDLEAARQLDQARQEYLSEARESFAGGAGFDKIWREILGESADWLSGAQANEQNVIQDAIKALQGSNSNDAQAITTAVYDGAMQVVNAINGLLDGVPKYAEGGMVQRKTFAMLGERGPELVVPMRHLTTVSGYDVSRRVSYHQQPESRSSDRRMLFALERLARSQSRTEERLARIEASNESVAASNGKLVRWEARRSAEIKR